MKNHQKRSRQNNLESDGREERRERMRPAAHPDRGAGYSRPPLARMLRLHQWLMENRYPNCRKISEEFEVSAKTVQRDINFMRDQMGLPIDYDKARFGFHYTRAVTSFPSMGVATKRKNPWKQAAPAPLGESPALTWRGARGLPVRIRFDPESARAVRRRVWHPTQAIRPMPDGGIELSLHARGDFEIARWVLSWAGHAWVTEPARLRHQVREMARQVLARH